MKINLLKGKMVAQGYNGKLLGEYMERTGGYVCKCLNEPNRFKLKEVYKICDILEIPYEEIPVYFPKER